jgi:hypothetical protein
MLAGLEKMADHILKAAVILALVKTLSDCGEVAVKHGQPAISRPYITCQNHPNS